jgi:hypothetical protein
VARANPRTAHGLRASSQGHIVIVAALAFAIGLAMTSPVAQADSNALARDAVARFYAWYTPLAAHTPGADLRALRDSRWHFDAALAAALRADVAASGKSPSEVVGLDMDPFLNSQDPCNRYAPTGVRRDGTSRLVDVRGSGGCEAHQTTDVTVRVAFQSDHVVFSNFIYSRKAGDDLRHILVQLAADRSKKRTPH